MNEIARLSFTQFSVTVMAEDGYRAVLFHAPDHDQALVVTPTTCGWNVNAVDANSPALLQILGTLGWSR